MGMEILVILKPEALTYRLFAAAATKLGENVLKSYSERPDRPAALQVKCTRIEATDYGLVQLFLGENGQPPAVAVRQELVVGVLEAVDRLPVGFLSD